MEVGVCVLPVWYVSSARVRVCGVFCVSGWVGRWVGVTYVFAWDAVDMSYASTLFAGILAFPRRGRRDLLVRFFLSQDFLLLKRFIPPVSRT